MSKVTFSEDDIRPVTNNCEKSTALLKDIGFLLFHREQFVEVNCPVCGCKGSSYFTKNCFEYKRCPICATVFVTPRPSEQLLAQFYAKSATYAYWNLHIFPQSESSRIEHIIEPRVTRVIELCRMQDIVAPRLLEVGPGYGTFAKCIRSRRFCSEIDLVELSEDLAAECASQGFHVRSQINRNDVERPYDIIASFETLEHMFSPKSFLQECFEILRPGGLLIITVPNFQGFEISTLKLVSRSVDHEHLNYFNPKSLSNLFEDCGFVIASVQTPGELDCDIVRNAILSGSIDFAQDSFLYHILIEKWEQVGMDFQAFLKSNLLSSHLWVAGKKP